MRVEFLLERMQALEVIKLVDVFIDPVHHPFNGWIVGLLANPGEGTQPQVEAVTALFLRPT